MPQLPDYLASARPNPKEQRAGWLFTTASSYAGIMLWFALWQDIPSGGQPVLGGVLSQGLGLAVFSLLLSALLCHFLCYLVPGLLGMKTGLSLSVVGSSTFGARGGLIMPGFLMGVLQFGWLSVNAYTAGLLLAGIAGQPIGGIVHNAISVSWILLAVVIGMKGVRSVGAVASFSPILPVLVLVLLLVNTFGGIGEFRVDKMMHAAEKKKMEAVESLACPGEIAVGATDVAVLKQLKADAEARPASLYGSATLGVIALVCAYMIGYFATAGAAGVDFGANNRDAKAVQFGGLIGIVLSTTLTGIAALLVFAGAQKNLPPEMLSVYRVTNLMKEILGPNLGNACMLMLAIAAFPSACFPSVVAANAFKACFPKINPIVTCTPGVLTAILLSLTGLAGKIGDVFTVVGASFGPICGAMAADYLLSGRRWAGPRVGFNKPGWIAWLTGFIVGGTTLFVEKIVGMPMPFEIPCPPLSAILVGFVCYWLCAKAGLETPTLELPHRIDLGDVSNGDRKMY